MSVWMIGYWYGMSAPVTREVIDTASWMYIGERDWWAGFDAGLMELSATFALSERSGKVA